MSERLDVRLSEEEKKNLAKLAGQRGISMTDLVRMWITRGDIVHVLAEQLQDFVSDFNKWHVSEGRNTTIVNLCIIVRQRDVDIERRKMIYGWISFFERSFKLMVRDVRDLMNRLKKFTKQKQPMERTFLIKAILDFSQAVTSYHNIFVQGFMDILQAANENTQAYVGGLYNDEFRTRFNEIASKYEDFLKRTQRELGEGLETVIPRAKEFRKGR